jgi:hypothetical protein
MLSFCYEDRDMKRIARISALVAIVGAAALLAGCGETYERQAVLVGVPLPMTTDDVVAAAKGGADEADIIAELQGRGYEGALTTKDVDQLRADGVPEGAIDWMLAHPSPEPMRSAPIVAQNGQVVYAGPPADVVYVNPGPEVVYVERPPRVTYSIGFGYSWGHYRHRGPYYHGHYSHRSYPRTRVIRSGGRVYRYTSGH